ncbi:MULTISPECIES: fructosamine kinase family protein [unclassified Luteococcus]|uniref:fructosamine kinase family protein n=1 Tax=unclassified Luteococcus TaxID=2639923 RepID=UPI00313AF1CB
MGKHSGPRHALPPVQRWRAAGLTWLDEAPDGVRVLARRPRPRAASEPSTAKAAEKFGRALARTHLAGAPGFGAAPPGWRGDGFFSREPMPLPPADALPTSWGDFYARYRLLPAARAALAAGGLDAQSMQQVERLCEVLMAGQLDDSRPASRIHGDLWSRNLVQTKRGFALIRPSAHGGHAETDLATLGLFGAPFLDTIEGAWAEEYRPVGDWKARSQLHQLHTMLVHSALFANPQQRSYYEGRMPHQAGEIAESYANKYR